MKSIIFISGSAASFCSVIWSNRLTPSNVRRFHNLQELGTKTSVMESFNNWSNKWFEDVSLQSPVFKMSGKDIKVLYTPEDFYQELLKQSSQAKERITLASLYLGNGEKEAQLVNTILENMQSLKKPPNVNILLEYTRGSRGSKNSRTMLLPLLRQFNASTNVALFHTPNLRGLLKTFVPERFDETINVAHLKVYLFDNTLIMSGANLSNDYFTNRQDRYIVLEHCKELCDYYEELVQTISKFSFQLQPDDTVELHEGFLYHPYKDPKKKFNEAAEELLRAFNERHVKKNNKSCDILNLLKTTSNNTLVIPLLQMRTMGVTQDEEVTRNILKYAPVDTDMTLATAYFNLTDKYWQAILESSPKIKLIMAAPKAMGFYNAPGMAGGIPNAYSLISKRRFKDILKFEETDRINFLEFHRENWTFHGKGLWAFIHQNKETKESSHSDTPFLTLIGSPNFGKRSVYRDMESQIAIVTVDHNLQQNLIREKNNLVENSTSVTMETYNAEDRKIHWWVYLIATFMNELF